ncbi:MAG: DUF2127 domain-containing protein [Actinomycetes bacterium]
MKRNQELKICSRVGHALFVPADDDRIKSVLNPYPNLVQCLRCGDLVSSDDTTPQPLATFPIVLRGSHGRRAALLRILAAERLIRAFLLITLAALTLKLSVNSNPVIAYIGKISDASKPLVTQLGFSETATKILKDLQSILHRTPTSYRWIALALVTYGLVQLFEGVGLWLLKRWAEYLTVVATSAFIPLEIYELLHKATVLKSMALVVNVAAVGYLLWKGRLFGLRGGHSAYRQEEYETTYLYELIKD